MLSSITFSLLWLIAGCTGFGAFIDFWIGKKGQKDAKEWLEVRWYRFADVNARNFAVRESERCVEVLDFLVGAHFVSWRRWIATLAVLVFALLTFVLLASQNGYTYDSLQQALVDDSSSVTTFIQTLITLPIVFAASLSFTRLICVTVVRLSSRATTTIRNVFLFSAVLLLQYELLAVWGPLARSAAESVVPNFLWFDFSPLWRNGWLDWAGEYLTDACQLPSCVLSNAWPMSRVIGLLHGEPPYIGNGPGYESLAFWEFVTAVLNIMANGVRILVALAFVCWWLLLPLVRKPLLTLWARIVESDKPIFTLIFGGVAAIGGGIQTVLKHVS
jgi:hypothetical protein